MVWVALGGIVLQVIGLSGAIWGISDTYKEALNRILRDDLWADGSRFVQRRVLRRSPPSQVVTAAAAVIASSAVSASGRVQLARPSADAGTREQVAYLMRVVEVLSVESKAVMEEAERSRRELDERVERRLKELSGRLDQTDQRLRSVGKEVLGADGRGLRRATLGLAITLVGVLLTIAGLPW